MRSHALKSLIMQHKCPRTCIHSTTTNCSLFDLCASAPINGISCFFWDLICLLCSWCPYGWFLHFAIKEDRKHKADNVDDASTSSIYVSCKAHDPDLTTKSPTHLPSREQVWPPEATAGMDWSLHWDPENAIIPFFSRACGHNCHSQISGGFTVETGSFFLKCHYNARHKKTADLKPVSSLGSLHERQEDLLRKCWTIDAISIQEVQFLLAKVWGFS